MSANKETMKRKLFCYIFIITLFTGCAGPRYTGFSIKHPQKTEVVIIEDKETRIGFRTAMESWLTENDFQYIILPDGSPFDQNKINLEYEGHWNWDLALFLYDARITAFCKGQKVGEVRFKAPNSLNLNKYGHAETRIKFMMDALFAKISFADANNKLKERPKEESSEKE